MQYYRDIVMKIKLIQHQWSSQKPSSHPAFPVNLDPRLPKNFLRRKNLDPLVRKVVTSDNKEISSKRIPDNSSPERVTDITYTADDDYIDKQGSELGVPITTERTARTKKSVMPEPIVNQLALKPTMLNQCYQTSKRWIRRYKLGRTFNLHLNQVKLYVASRDDHQRTQQDMTSSAKIIYRNHVMWFLGHITCC